jgi:NADH-quinone oxidoreductase subunit C
MPDMELNLTTELKAVIDGLTADFSDKVFDVYQSSGDTFVLIDASSNVEICKYLKEKHHFIYLGDVFGIDRYTSEDRFEIVYNLVNLRHRLRLFVKVRCSEERPEVETMCSVWESANWNEREVYDMFGIHFRNHPDLRRMFMPEDFRYFPLRKEFPLLGIPGSIELPATNPETE